MKKKMILIILLASLILIFSSIISFAGGYTYTPVEDATDIEDYIFEQSKILLIFICIYLFFEVIVIFKNKEKIKKIIEINISIILVFLLILKILNFLGAPCIYKLKFNIVFIIIVLLLQIFILKKNKKSNKLKIINLILFICVCLSFIFATELQFYHKTEYMSSWPINYIYRIINKNQLNEKILEVDEEGILIEYDNPYYVYKGTDEEVTNLFDEKIFEIGYEIKYKNVKQKLLWNTWYQEVEVSEPMVVDDRGSFYFIKLVK